MEDGRFRSHLAVTCYSQRDIRTDAGVTATVARLGVTRVDAIVVHGISDRSEVSLDVPFVRITRQPTGGVTRVTQGLGDVRATWRRLLTQTDRFSFYGSAGVSLPTGRPIPLTRASFFDPDEAERLGLPPTGDTRLQLGTGVVYPSLGLEAAQAVGDSATVSASVQANFPFYANRFGYRTGTSLSGQLGGTVAFGDGDLAVGLHGSAYYSARDWFFGQDLQTANGVIAGTLAVANTRRFEVGLRPSVTARLGDVTVAAQGLVPAYVQPFAMGNRFVTQPAGAYVEASLRF